MAARATEAEVLKLHGGVHPPGVDATNVGNLLDAADYHMDGYAKKYYSTTLSTTDTSIVYAANMTVAQLGSRIVWYQAGGPLSGVPQPPVLSDEVIFLIDASLIDSTTAQFDTLDMIDDSL